MKAVGTSGFFTVFYVYFSFKHLVICVLALKGMLPYNKVLNIETCHNYVS